MDVCNLLYSNWINKFHWKLTFFSYCTVSYRVLVKHSHHHISRRFDMMSLFRDLSRLIRSPTAQHFPVCSATSGKVFVCAKIHQSRILMGLDEFFENGQSLPPFDPATRQVYGRAWSADELRRKSFDDLHRLWWVLIKERNLLATQAAEARRMGQRWFGNHRVHKCGLSMARIKTILTERQMLHEKAASLLKQKQLGKSFTEAELLIAQQKQDKMRQLWRKRHFRKRMNYYSRRRSLFA